eukprot:54290-Pyramimonas_sp.AAC.1
MYFVSSSTAPMVCSHSGSNASGSSGHFNVKGKQPRYRACQLSDEAMVDLVKRRVSLIEKNYINGTTEQILKDNMPFLLGACQVSQRLSTTTLARAI